MAHLSPLLYFQPLDANGDIMPGAKLYTYAAGTSTPLATYTDQTQGTLATNPIVLDLSGSASVWLADVAYKLVLKSSTDVVLKTWDQVRHINLNSIDTNSIQDNAVTTDKIADGAVNIDQIADNAVTTPKIAPSAVTTAKIADSNVTTAKIADSNVTTAKLADSSVTTAKIAANAVTLAKLAARTTGTTIAAGGFGITSSSGGTFCTVSYADVTNFSVTITTTGRPVIITLIPDGSANAARLQAYSSGGAAIDLNIKFIRDSTDIAINLVESGPGYVTVPVGAAYHVDTPAAGTYTYKIQQKYNGGSSTIQSGILWAKMIVYEMA